MPSTFSLLSSLSSFATSCEVLRVFGSSGFSAVVVLVEAGHRDDADLERAAVAHDALDFLVRRLGLQGDLVARQLDHLLRGAGHRPGRQDLQAHLRAGLAADQLHDIVQAPADDVGERAALALADAGDAVVDVQRAGHGRRAAVDDVHDGDVVVVQLQRGTDAVVVEAHLDAVFLGGARREVARVRVEGARVGVHQVLEHVLAAHLVDALEHALVALAQDVGRLRPALAGEHEREGVVLDALPPQLVHARLIGDPVRLAAVELEGLVQRPVRLGAKQRDRMVDALAVALLEAGEDHVGRIHRAGADHVVELEAVGVELVDVALQEVAALAVEELQVALVDDLGHLVIEGGAAVVLLLEDAADLARGGTLLVGRGDRPGGQGGGVRRDLRGTCQHQGKCGQDHGGKPPGGTAQD